VGLLVSTATGLWLLRALFGPLQLVRNSAVMLAERDFSTRLREVGQPELDALIAVYNRMIDALREERLRALEQHHFLEEVVRASPAGVLTFDFDGRLTTANPGAERLLRCRAAEMAGRPLRELPVPFIERVAGLEVGGSVVLPLFGNRRVRWQKSQFMDHGSPRLLLLVEELTEELRRSERAAYEKIVRVLSHEINNSIGAGTSLLESCLRYAEQIVPADRGDFETALEVTVARMRHLNAFVRSYAEVVRLPPPRRGPVDLARLVEDVGRLFQGECATAGITFSLECRAPEASVSLDAHQIEQVLVNVLRNALEAAGPGGWVRVRLDGQGSPRPVLTVEDSGPGVSSEAETQLFTPFFSTKENGRGIGLTVAQEVLTQHGFAFTLEGPRDDAPTRFTIRF
jgi:two-component system nitrogen regulation sensor histidine kinase NtrY